MAAWSLLYGDVMTWRAISNALAGLLAGLAGGVLLGALIVIWGVTVFTLATSVNNWEHVAVYVGIVEAGMATLLHTDGSPFPMPIPMAEAGIKVDEAGRSYVPSSAVVAPPSSRSASPPC